MKKILKFIGVLLLISMIFISCDSKKYKNISEKDSINVFVVDIKKDTMEEVFSKVFKKFEKKNSIKINTIYSKDKKVLDEILNNEKIDLIISSRKNLVTLKEKGILKNLDFLVKENSIKDRFYDSFTLLGLKEESYYGIGVLPYTLEVIYNKGTITGVPDKKELKNKNITIPVILPEEVKLEELYKLMDIKDEKIKEILYVGRKEELISINNGEIPVAVISSYYAKDIDKSRVSIFDYSKIYNYPIFIDGIMMVPERGNINMEVFNLIKFALSDEVQEEFSKEGLIGANKKVNEMFKGKYEEVIVNHIKKGIIYNIKE